MVARAALPECRCGSSAWSRRSGFGSRRGPGLRFVERLRERHRLRSASLLDDDSRDAIVASGLFDQRWYCAEYPDVSESGLDPFSHFWRAVSPRPRPRPGVQHVGLPPGPRRRRRRRRGPLAALRPLRPNQGTKGAGARRSGDAPNPSC